MLHLFLLGGGGQDWALIASMLQAYASAAGWETPAEFPNLDTHASEDRAFLTPNLPGFNHGTISINLLAVTMGAEGAGSQASIHKATNLSAIKAAPKEDSNIIGIIFLYIYMYIVISRVLMTAV